MLLLLTQRMCQKSYTGPYKNKTSTEYVTSTNRAKTTSTDLNKAKKLKFYLNVLTNCYKSDTIKVQLTRIQLKLHLRIR